MSMDLTSLTATMSIADTAHVHAMHQRSPSGSDTPHSTVPSSSDRTPESERVGYDMDPLASASISDEERETKCDRRTSASRKVVEPSERRTVFVPNLPRDATQREVTNMFAFCPGFVKVQLYDQLKNTGQEGRISTIAGGGKDQSQQETQGETNCMSPGAAPSQSPTGTGQTALTHFGAFVLFDSPQAAVLAKERLHGLVFDTSQSQPVILQARIAMKNLFLTREEQMEIGTLQQQGPVTTKSSRRGSFNGQSVIPPSEIARLAQLALVAQQQNQHALTGALTREQQEYVAQFSPLLQASTPPYHAAGYSPTGYHSPALNGYASALQPPSIQGGMHSPVTQAYYQQDAATVPNSPLHSPVHHSMQAAFGGSGGGYAQNYRTGNGLYHGSSYGGHNNHAHGAHHSHGVGPFNPPCTTLFLARLEQLSNDELFQLLINSFPTMRDHKFMIDSKNQRIAFVEFDSIESASVAQQRINGYCGISCAFSKNPLNQRK